MPGWATCTVLRRTLPAMYIADVGSLASDPVFFVTPGSQVVRKISGGVVTTVAGNGTAGFSGDNGPATAAQLNSTFQSWSVGVDTGSHVYLADSGGSRVRKVSNGVIMTVAGNGTYGFSGDHGPGASAQINGRRGIAVDSAGNVYIADVANNRIRVATPVTSGPTANSPTISA